MEIKWQAGHNFRYYADGVNVYLKHRDGVVTGGFHLVTDPNTQGLARFGEVRYTREQMLGGALAPAVRMVEFFLDSTLEGFWPVSGDREDMEWKVEVRMPSGSSIQFGMVVPLTNFWEDYMPEVPENFPNEVSGFYGILGAIIQNSDKAQEIRDRMGVRMK
jgi:hypothetical protein